MKNEIRLTSEAKDAARKLVTGWDADDIPQQYTLVEVPGDNTVMSTFVFGGDKNFSSPERPLLLELKEANLIRIDQVDDNSWEIVLLQALRDAVNNDFGTREVTGNFYTPPALIEMMINLIKPKVGETIYDPACGIGSILTSAYRYMLDHSQLSQEEKAVLRQKTFFGREIHLQTFIHATENFGSNGLNPNNLWHGNTLLKHTHGNNLPSQFDIVIVNTPFSSNATAQEQAEFEYPTRYYELLFLQHALESLKPGGRCAIVLPEGVIVRTDREFREVKRKLLIESDLQRVVRLDNQLAPYTHIKFNVIVFRKGIATTKFIYIDGNKPAVTVERSIVESNNYDLTPPDDAPLYNEVESSSPNSADPLSHRIFISYRRDDASWPTGRVYDYLSSHLKSRIFRDRESIGIGKKFNEEILAALNSCHVLIAVIGANWLTTTGESGEQRLFHPDDWVRKEISTAIKREIMIIPILIDDAKMPRVDELPEEIRDFAFYNALPLTSGSFSRDIKPLIQTIEDTLYTIDYDPKRPK